MDRRTTLALALCLIIFALFTALGQKYAPKPVPRRVPVAGTAQIGATNGSLAPADSSAPNGAAAVAAVAAATGIAEQHSVIETPLYRAEFTNAGARLLKVELKKYGASFGASDYSHHPERLPHRGEDVPAGDRVTLGGEPTFALDLGSGASRRRLDHVMYSVAESTDAAGAVRALTFTATDSGGMTLRQVWRVRPDSYLLDLAVDITHVPDRWHLTDYSLTMRSWALMTESNPKLELRSLRTLSLVGKDVHRDGAQGIVGKERKVEEGVAHWAGVQSHYFMALIATSSNEGRAAWRTAERRQLTAEQLAVLPKDTDASQPVAVGTLVMPVPATGTAAHHFVAYFGPADYFSLAKQSGPLELERAVDMGWSWIVPISRLMLQLLRAVESVVKNYGVAIFLLATIVRLLLHPFNMSSMKSMRSMQRLQPEIGRLREKYKNDASALNTATMALYRENSVNPAGGCLPMVLQMPLFFSMYAVINNAIDLRHAPFGGWIHDLSAPDLLMNVGSFPIRLLPILMAVTGLLSQRFAPTDPKQAPTMYMMNVVMLGIFYNLPSGLVFYWTVMNLLTTIQQWLAMRGENGVVVVTAPPEKTKKGRRPSS